VTDSRQPDHAALLKRSLIAIDQLQAKLAALERERNEPIAIVGIGCRFPMGADTPAAFWSLLRDGVDAVTVVPSERWDADAFFDPDPDAPGKSYTRWGAFVRDVDRFDPAFFGVSPREAVSMDPQQRLLLEVAWESLEHAGIAPSSLAGSQTAVYVGITTHDYAMQLAEAVGSRNGDAYTPSGTAHSVAAGRLSYVMGLHGPNVAIDTACSSSLVALHWALHSLRSRESDVALAGGVNLTLTPDGSVLTSRARMMSFDGRCKTFDSRADGYVRGEGCGMLVLKRLSDAQRDGDTVLALVRGSALNQDGRSSGLTAPNGLAQEAVIRAALANARLQPGDVSYVEAHGTGTPLGDPIEIKALQQVYAHAGRAQPLQVASVKTNIGHLEAAAGIAGVIKTVLALQHRQIPPHLHLKQPNPLIPWDAAPITVPTALTPWESPPGVPRRAGISSFGFSGTNAHVILEEAPAADAPPAAAPGAQALLLSAHTPQALGALAGALERRLGQPDAPALDAVAATLALGRSALTERAVLVVQDPADARAQLAAAASGAWPPSAARGRASGAPEVVFLYTGQGAQHPGMGKRLYDTEPVFRDTLDRCAAIVATELEHPLLEVMFGAGPDGLLDDTAYTQPALFALEYALTQLYRSWGIEPTAVMGHSVGEWVAACVAGVFSLDDALRLVAARGRLMSRLPRDGGMAAVYADEATVLPALHGHEATLSIAATNGPQNTVLAGSHVALQAVLQRLAAQGIEAQPLNVSHAFHSPAMDPMLDEFERLVAGVRRAPPQIELISNVTGRVAGADVCEPGYWRRHVRQAVRFGESIDTLRHQGYRLFVEMGPHATLLGMAQRGRADAGDCAWVASLRKGRDDTTALRESLGQLHVRGLRVDWRAVLGPDAQRRRAVLPCFPFQRERYWQDLGGGKARAALEPLRQAHPLLQGALPSALPIFAGELALARQPWLRDHAIFGFVLFPGTGFLELALGAARTALGTSQVALRSLELREALPLPDDGSVQVQVVTHASSGATLRAEVFSRRVITEGSGTPWRLHASCLLAAAEATVAPQPPVALHSLRERLTTPCEVAPYYDRLAAQGAHYGPAFRAIAQIRRRETEVLGQVQLPTPLSASASQWLLHPALLDACFQLVGAALEAPTGASDPESNLCVPVGLAEYRLLKPGVAAAWCHAKVAPVGDEGYRADLWLFDDAGAAVAQLEGLELRRTTRAALERIVRAGSIPDWHFETEWQAKAIEPAVRGEPGLWLVLADASGVGNALASALRAAGASVTCVRPGEAFLVEGDAWTVPPADPDAWRSALAGFVQRHGRPPDGVVALWALDAPARADTLPQIETAQRVLLASLLALAQGAGDGASRLWVATRAAQPVLGTVPDLVQAPLWGLAGVMASEYPAHRCVRIDLDRTPHADDARLLFDEVWSPDGEDRVAHRQGQRLVARLVAGRAPAAREDAVCLEIRERGTLENLQLRPVERRAPGSGEVEIRVHATGLNFRDVLNALGMYPGDPGPLGNECAGVVTAVGAGVTDLQIGDEVVAMVDRSFATWVVAPAALTVRKPVSLTFAAAATVPVTFLTALYALRDLAHIKRGDRVLIHAVTGGVGMAALQLALRAGATVIGTAGSPAKRALALSLGAHHIADSRSLGFADSVRKATDGAGVDIVLNSLAGDFIPESLRLLRPGGHFVEIGKTGIWNAQQVSQHFPGVNYHALYLGEVAAARPAFVQSMLADILRDIDAGSLRPLPMRCYPLDQAEQAFRFMGQGHHTGKIVLTQTPPLTVRGDAAYLVTGGLGGLGLACAGWLADAGARHLVLMGRRAPGTAALEAIAALRARGVQVRVQQGDVADAVAVAAALQPAAGQPPLRGILHAAGAVDDALMSELTPARFEGVMAPKVAGSWHLHTLSAALPLDFFVMFSSGAALLGSPGQGNYAAANSFMDALAHVRRAEGRHALSINWGSWSDVGMAAGVGEQHQRRWAALGLAMIAPAEGVQMLAQLVQSNGSTQAAALPLVRSRLGPQHGPFFSLLTKAAPLPSTREASAAVSADWRSALAAAAAGERQGLLVSLLAEQLIKVLALPTTQRVDTQRSLMDLGMDSLMAMELRNRVQGALKVQLAVADLLKGPSTEKLAADLLTKLGELGTAVPAGAHEPAEPAAVWEEGTL
jgi:acyl transferase domain-containing protein/aryl carrier-like protein